MKEFRKRYWYEVALCASFLPLIYSPIAYTADMQSGGEELIAADSHWKVAKGEDTYTVNFNNISLSELIRFASKITGLNFVFNEGDLPFSVTLVSEEPVSAKSMMAILSQVLRMHDLILLEQEGNVLITKSMKVGQIPPIVSSDLPDSKAGNAALVTRVFRIKNANPNSLAAIIRPMTSQGALIEVSAETRQLIVTDITTNVEQIAALLTSLDAPHTPLDVESFTVKNIPPGELILLVEPILRPFTEGNPFILVPQGDTNTIFVVSTPSLIERAMSIMEDLDIPVKPVLVGKDNLTGKEVFIYKPIHLSPQELMDELSQIGANLKNVGGASSPLEIAIESAQEVKDTNSVMFMVDAGSAAKLKELLASLDSSPLAAHPGELAKSTFLVYAPQHRPGEELLNELNDIENNLKQSGLADRSFLSTLGSMKWVPTTNSLIFTGDPQSIERIQGMLKGLDAPNAVLKSSEVFIYKPQHVSPDQIKSVLDSLIPGLKNTHTLFDANLVNAIEQMKWNPENHSFIVTTDPATIERLKNLLASIDTEQPSNVLLSKGFFLYKLQNAQCDAVLVELKNVVKKLPSTNLQNQNLLATVNRIECIPSNNSLLITGTNDTIERAKILIAEFDVPSPVSISKAAEKMNASVLSGLRNANTFVIYNPKYVSGEELISILCDFMQNLIASGVADPGLFDTIGSLKWIDKTSSLLISGNQQSIDKVQQLLVKFDIPGKGTTTPSIESIDNTSFLVYKLQYHPGNDIQTALQQVATSLSKGTTSPAALVDAIHSLQWIEVTNSLLCSGQQDVLVKLKDLIKNLDIPLRQVFIEVLVINTTLNNQQNFGLQWGGQVQYFNKTVLQTGNFPVASPPSQFPPSTPSSFPNTLNGINGTTSLPKGGIIPFSSGFDLGVIGDIIMHKGKSFISLGSLLNAIQQDNDSTIILNPKIITQDNRQSTIFVGQNIPYTGALVTNSSNSQTTTQNIEYRDVGVSLTITPILGDGDVITMEIVQDISQVVNGTNVTNSNANLNGIQTSHTHMETRVHVPNNHFVALSGMINDTKTHFRTAIPCLGGLPVVGALFSENDRSAQKNNIIIFVRPQIITSYSEYKAITEHQEWLYKDNARLPVLKEEFDEGIDMVKLPENE